MKESSQQNKKSFWEKEFGNEPFIILCKKKLAHIRKVYHYFIVFYSLAFLSYIIFTPNKMIFIYVFGMGVMSYCLGIYRIRINKYPEPSTEDIIYILAYLIVMVALTFMGLFVLIKYLNES